MGVGVVESQLRQDGPGALARRLSLFEPAVGEVVVDLGQELGRLLPLRLGTEDFMVSSGKKRTAAAITPAAATRKVEKSLSDPAGPAR